MGREIDYDTFVYTDRDTQIKSDDVLCLRVARKILAFHDAAVHESEIPLPTDLYDEYVRVGKPMPKSWSCTSKHGGMSLDGGSEQVAVVTAAMMYYLYDKGIEISLARDLACSYMDRRIGREPVE